MLKSSKRYFMTGPLVVVSIPVLMPLCVGWGLGFVTTRTKKQKQAHLINTFLPGSEIDFINWFCTWIISFSWIYYPVLSIDRGFVSGISLEFKDWNFYNIIGTGLISLVYTDNTVRIRRIGLYVCGLPVYWISPW